MSTTSTDVGVVEVGFGHGGRQLAGELGECESIRLDVCSRSSRRPRPGEVLSLSRRGAPDIPPDHASFTVVLPSNPRRTRWLRESQLR